MPTSRGINNIEPSYIITTQESADHVILEMPPSFAAPEEGSWPCDEELADILGTSIEKLWFEFVEEDDAGWCCWVVSKEPPFSF